MLPETKGGKEEKSKWGCGIVRRVATFGSRSIPTAHSRLDRKRPKGNVRKQSMSMYSDRAGVVRAKELDSEPNVRPSLTLSTTRRLTITLRSTQTERGLK